MIHINYLLFTLIRIYIMYLRVIFSVVLLH